MQFEHYYFIILFMHSPYNINKHRNNFTFAWDGFKSRYLSKSIQILFNYSNTYLNYLPKVSVFKIEYSFLHTFF